MLPFVTANFELWTQPMITTIDAQRFSGASVYRAIIDYRFTENRAA